MAVFQFNLKVGKLIKKQQNKAKTEIKSHFCLSVLIFLVIAALTSWECREQ